MCASTRVSAIEASTAPADQYASDAVNKEGRGEAVTATSADSRLLKLDSSVCAPAWSVAVNSSAAAMMEVFTRPASASAGPFCVVACATVGERLSGIASARLISDYQCERQAGSTSEPNGAVQRMAFRSFTDSAGTMWQVWDVVPLLSERRGDERRDSGGDDRASGPERRHDDRRIVSARRATLSGSFASGWLCFESLRQRRRLTPIPSDWKSCDERRLEQYMRRADAVAHGRNATGSAFDEPRDELRDGAG